MSISFKQIVYTYSKDTPYQYTALNGIDLDIEEGKITAVIGQTGSGKSTLVQHLNALLLPESGEIQILDRTIKGGEKQKNLKELRHQVGLVFQFPEYQLFEETVLKDVAFGPKNFGISEEEAEKKAKEALKLVGLDEETYDKSPFELSGGQKRRAAIAGILAMDPKILVLDEPTAGLDPMGTVTMMSLFHELNQKYGKTLIIVTHDMEQVFKYCDSVVVLADGKVMVHEDVSTFFRNSDLCREMNILPPALLRMKDLLAQQGIIIDESVQDIDSLADEIARQVKAHG